MNTHPSLFTIVPYHHKLQWLAIVAICIIATDQAMPAHCEQTAAPESAEAEAADERASADNLLRRMTSQGISLDEQTQFVLPPPSFVSIEGESVDETAAKKALAEIAGPQGVSRFTRDSIVAPISTQTDSINNEAGDRVGHFIDVAFVVHQSVAEIRKSETMEDFKSDPDDPNAEAKTIEFADQDNPDEIEKNKTRSLTKAELAKYNVKLDGQYEALGYLQMPLLSKVVVRGVARARRSVWSADDQDAPIILTWLLDARFASEAPEAESIANQWRAIERSEVGEKELGPPQPNAGMGGYIAITPLPGDAAASMVQLRFVIHEPQAWFNGKNLLRSKLPILIQDRVRNLRRELED